LSETTIVRPIIHDPGSKHQKLAWDLLLHGVLITGIIVDLIRFEMYVAGGRLNAIYDRRAEEILQRDEETRI